MFNYKQGYLSFSSSLLLIEIFDCFGHSINAPFHQSQIASIIDYVYYVYQI